MRRPNPDALADTIWERVQLHLDPQLHPAEREDLRTRIVAACVGYAADMEEWAQRLVRQG